MGGCRCTFQYCENSTQLSPGSHFFHYPVKDPERLKKWTYFANNPSFLDLPFNKLRNKVVCQNHFKEACFMNVKHESLTKLAVPTLIAYNGFIIDLEMSEETFEGQKAIPMDDILSARLPPAVPIKTAEIPLKFSPTPVDKKIKILNNSAVKRARYTENLEISELDNEIIVNTMKTESAGQPKKPAKIIPRILNKSVKRAISPANEIVPDLPDEIEDNDPLSLDESAHPSVSTILESVVEPQILTTMSEQSMQDAISTAITSSFIKVDPLDSRTFTEYASNQKSEFSAAMKQIFDNQALILEKISSAPVSSGVVGTSDATSTTTTSSVKTTVNKSEVKSKFNQNKIQLFNGIKKYLNPAMVALLRMELFGTTEREWKNDEKNVSVELFNLGRPTYEYLRDEWRFRLPPIKDAEGWAEGDGIYDSDAE